MLLLLGAAFAAATQSPAAAMVRPSTPAAMAPRGMIVPNSRPLDRMSVLDPDSMSPASCPATSRYEAEQRGGKLKGRKLNELPMADAYSAVYRHIDKCLAPIIVKYGVGQR
jgi:hypothetical protein